jgi:hypothetical protein
VNAASVKRSPAARRHRGDSRREAVQPGALVAAVAVGTRVRRPPDFQGPALTISLLARFARPCVLGNRFGFIRCGVRFALLHRRVSEILIPWPLDGLDLFGLCDGHPGLLISLIKWFNTVLRTIRSSRCLRLFDWGRIVSGSDQACRKARSQQSELIARGRTFRARG